MPSETALQFEFVPPTNVFETLRVHLRLALMVRREKRIARRGDQALAALTPEMLDDIGATELLSQRAAVSLASHNPYVAVFGYRNVRGRLL